MSQKGNIILVVLLGLVIIVVLGGVFYWRYQLVSQEAKNDLPGPVGRYTLSIIKEHQQETVNWQTYTNTDLNLSFKYPNNYKLVDGYFYPEGSDIYRNFKLGAILIGSENKNSNRCFSQDKDKDQGITFKAEDTKLVESTPLMVNGIQGTKESLESLFAYDNEGNGKLYVTNFCFNKLGKAFTLSFYNLDKPPTLEEQRTIDQIIYTFKFANQN